MNLRCPPLWLPRPPLSALGQECYHLDEGYRTAAPQATSAPAPKPNPPSRAICDATHQSSAGKCGRWGQRYTGGRAPGICCGDQGPCHSFILTSLLRAQWTGHSLSPPSWSSGLGEGDRGPLPNGVKPMNVRLQAAVGVRRKRTARGAAGVGIIHRGAWEQLSQPLVGKGLAGWVSASSTLSNPSLPL